jgi:glycosyltransferase involved in cell wall biosynthesis
MAVIHRDVVEGGQMKVLIVKDRASAGGGIVTFYDTLNDYFSAEVDYVMIGRPHTMYASGKIPVLEKCTLTRLLLDYSKLIRRIVTFRPDVVLINSSIERGGRAIARDCLNVVVSKVMGCKTILFWHGFVSGGEQFPFRGGNKGVVCRLYKMSDAFIVLARQFGEDLKRWGIKKPVFVETTTIGKELIENGAIRRRQAPENKRSLLFLSRIIREKGIIELIEAYSILKQKHSGFQLCIAGNGDDLKYVTDYVAKKGIRDVHVLGHVTGEEKFKAFENASIFCFPSYAGEGMPVAVLEAMAMGLPLVSSQVSGLKDILEDGKNGMILGRIEPHEIADRISELVENDGLRDRISENNRKYAAERFHPRRCAERLENICRSVVTNQ